MCDHQTGQGRACGTRHVDADHVKPGGGRELVAWHQLGDQSLPGGGEHGLAGADGKGECEQQRRRHQTGSGEPGEQGSDNDEVDLYAEHEPATVECVG